jgi:hypothetical protein
MIEGPRQEAKLRFVRRTCFDDIAVIDGRACSCPPPSASAGRFLAGRRIGNLLSRVTAGATAASVISQWRADSPPERIVLQLLQWLWQRELMVGDADTDKQGYGT